MVPAKLRYKIFSSIFIIVLLFDQWTKFVSLKNLKGAPTQNYLWGLFKLIYAENRGAWGSMGSDLDSGWHFLLLIMVPATALLVFTVFLFKSAKITKPEVYAYSLILSGGFGNIIDRILHGYVIDFMYIGYGRIGTNIFNIADVVIMVGVGILLLQYIQEKIQKPDKIT
jgi:signal peptidase II